MTVEEDVLDLEARRIRAMSEGDVDLMLSLLEDDHVHVRADGIITDKQGAAQALRGLAQPVGAPPAVVPGPIKVRVYGDIAIMTGAQTNHVQINGQPATMQLFVTRVARRTDGAWRFVSMQATPMAA